MTAIFNLNKLLSDRNNMKRLNISNNVNTRNMATSLISFENYNWCTFCFLKYMYQMLGFFLLFYEKEHQFKF